MNSVLLPTLVVVAFIVLATLVLLKPIRRWMRFRDTQVVECPETRRPAAVEVAPGASARQALTGKGDLRLQNCSRWPEREHCGQECLTQIDRTESDCGLKQILAQWYREADCALCGAPFGEIHWHDHRPCLLSPDREPLDWTGFRPEDVREVLETHNPICWNCYIAEQLRHRHPDRVVDRDRSASG